LLAGAGWAQTTQAPQTPHPQPLSHPLPPAGRGAPPPSRDLDFPLSRAVGGGWERGPGGEGLDGAAFQTPPAPPITAVEIRSETDISDRLGELQAMLSFAPGDPFTPEAAARTLRNIQASGIASEVEIYDRPDDTGADSTGVVVMLVLRPI